MTLTLVDWLVIGGYFALNLAIGLYYARRARGSTTELFLSGTERTRLILPSSVSSVVESL